MSDIELVIKISMPIYKAFMEDWTNTTDVLHAVRKGTNLPKGHGRLIDEKDLSLVTVHMIDGVFVCDAPTIIEADKAESENKK